MNIALIFAGGIGTRMGEQEKPKQFLEFSGRSVLIHTILNFENHKKIDGIIVVCLDSYIDHLRQDIEKNKIKKVKWIASGGKTGQESIYKGIKKVYEEVENPKDVIMLINDGVRPIVKANIIDANIESVKKHGSSITVCPVAETIVEVNEDEEIFNIPIRKYSYLSKAPQGFYLEDLMGAHTRAMKEDRHDLTNSAELMNLYGHKLNVVYDNEENIKITTPLDLVIWEEIMKDKE